jgi:hypothetical protein
MPFNFYTKEILNKSQVEAHWKNEYLCYYLHFFVISVAYITLSQASQSKSNCYFKHLFVTVSRPFLVCQTIAIKCQ